MSDAIELKLKEREALGKGLNKLRAEGQVPAVVHDHGKPSVHVMGEAKDLIKVYSEAGKGHPVELTVGSKKYLAMIKDAHIDPRKRQLQHIVFQAVNRNEKVEAEVPIEILGDIPAEKLGLLVLHQLDNVQVEALPANLPDVVTVDGSKLAELHDKVTVADLVIPEGVTILTEPEHAVATVIETPAQVSEEDEAAEAAAAAEAAEGEAAEGGEAPSDESAE